MKLPQGVTILASGRFRARATIDGKLMHLGVHDTAEDAARVIAAAHAIAAEKASRPRDTFRVWADAWIDERETSGAHRASATDRSRMRRHVYPHAWSDMPLRAIKVRHLRDWLHALELHDFAALNGGAAKWEVADTWADRVREATERPEVAFALDTIAREFWSGNTVCEAAIGRVGRKASSGD